MEDKKQNTTGEHKPEDVSRKQVRGSALLLSGRFLSMALNLLTQILVIRYLSKADYGLFAYALALISMLTTMNRLGMERAVARFVPVYEEKGDPASAAGVVVLAIGTLAGLGCAIMVLIVGFQGLLTGTLIENPAIMSLLVIMIALAPVNAIDDVMESLLSALGKPKIIFIRKYLIGPGLKLSAISLTMLASGDIYMLAISYMVAGIVGLLLYGLIIKDVLREHHMMQYFRPGRFSIRYRRLFGFSLPTFAAELTFSMRVVIIVVLLEYFHELSSVAEFRAVVPIARLNIVVLSSFSLLFIPMASRLFAQKNPELLGVMQSHTALWVMVLTYPLFALCITLAEPLIVLLIGDRYMSSAPVLAIMAVGYYFNAALGLHQRTLNAMGKVRVLLYIEIITITLELVLALWLARVYGAIGGAVALSVGMILYVIMNSVALWRITGKNPLPWIYARIYMIVALYSLGLWFAVSILGIESVLVLLLLVSVTSLLVMLSCRHLLQVNVIFPEVSRLPRILQRFLGVNI